MESCGEDPDWFEYEQLAEQDTLEGSQMLR